MREHLRGPFDLPHAFWAVPPGVIAAIAGRLLRRPVLLHLAAGDLVALHDLDSGSRRTARGRALAEDAESTARRGHELYEALTRHAG